MNEPVKQSDPNLQQICWSILAAFIGVQSKKIWIEIMLTLRKKD